jgi:superfamily II DNA/RNA helicase
MEVSFDKLGLNDNLVEGLKKIKITEPTDIQAQVIPLALDNKDIIAQSQTGSGKTFAYLLPLFQRIDTSKKEMQAIILAPTQELVMQVHNQVKLLAENSGVPITSAVVFGDVNIKRQVETLREKQHIIVGSTARIYELVKMKKISAHTIKTIVLDEADRLLGDEYLSGVKDLIKTTLRDRQLMAFSASIDEKTLKSAEALMKEPQVVKLQETLQINPDIKHMFFITEQRDKIEMLRKIVASAKPERAIVFINRSEDIQETTIKLQYHHLKCDGLYGSATKEERKKALEDFRTGKIQLLVASDLAARGLDVKGVSHIINLDFPRDSREYLHRAGRTGRAGEKGTCVSIVTLKETTTLKEYEKKFNIKIEEKDMHMGKIVEPFKSNSFNSKPVKKDSNINKKPTFK